MGIENIHRVIAQTGLLSDRSDSGDGVATGADDALCNKIGKVPKVSGQPIK